MNNQPLKNKIKYESYNKLLKKKSGLFSYDDVKSAVLFLKKEFDYLKKYDTQDIHKLILDKINKAFEDVFEDENM